MKGVLTDIYEHLPNTRLNNAIRALPLDGTAE